MPIQPHFTIQKRLYGIRMHCERDRRAIAMLRFCSNEENLTFNVCSVLPHSPFFSPRRSMMNELVAIYHFQQIKHSASIELKWRDFTSAPFISCSNMGHTNTCKKVNSLVADVVWLHPIENVIKPQNSRCHSKTCQIRISCFR